MPEILLIDDDAARRASLEVALQEAGYRVQTSAPSVLRLDILQAIGHKNNDAVVVVVPGEDPTAPEAHSLARWARALVPIIDSPEDPRTLRQWGRWVAASPGALRTWCRAADIAPRRSLVFGRLLRAVCLSNNGRCKLENLLNVVDRRTLVGLMRFSGFTAAHDFPTSVSAFLERQTLIRDPVALLEVTRALRDRHDHSYRSDLMSVAR